MKPHQLNGTYYPEEDRIMFRIKSTNNEEYRFWLTRIIVKKTLDVIEKISIKNISDNTKNKLITHELVETIDKMQQKSLEAITDLSIPFKTANSLPFGPTPQLIKEINFTFTNESAVKVKITDKDLRQIDFDFNATTLNKIRILLHELNKKADWGLTQEVNEKLQTSNTLHQIH
jgi:RNA-binding protein YhbY